MVRSAHLLRLAACQVAVAAACLAQVAAQSAQNVALSSLDLSKIEQDWGSPGANHSVENHPLSIGGKKFESGVGTHANSTFLIDLKGAALRFHAFVGVDDEVGKATSSVEFRVVGDGKELWKSGVMHAGDAAKELNVLLVGVKRLELDVGDADDGINFDHADWADARIEGANGTPAAADVAPETAEVLTPAPPPEPRIRGARRVGVRTGHPFLYLIAATGARPMSFAVDNLPKGLTLDANTGRITGLLVARGESKVTLHAKNDRGESTRELTIVAGDKIALTPPLGWNSWNCFAMAVDDAKVRAAADAMVASGLVQHGWTYINIDDCWEGDRGADGKIRTNSKFPDMKGLADYVHSKGLKFGVYSSPGPKTCAGFEASWQHEVDDAQTYASWGVDYLKYDWCSYDGIAKDHSLSELQKPYFVMRKALDGVGRDILFSLCQYGMGDVWEWGEGVGGNCWRTTGDITDTWSSMSSIGFGQAGHESFAGPGHWNDPDMLVVGKVGWGNLHPTHLKPNEQYTHISLWCLLSAPLLIGCDMSQLDEFTARLLTNDEVLEVDQDALGKQAARVQQRGELEVWSKPMEDGSIAVGLFNRSRAETQVTAEWSELGLRGKQRVRDLWRQSDVGEFEARYTATVAPHGVALVRLFAVK